MLLPDLAPDTSPGRAPQLPDRIALVLRDRILSGELRPGTFLRMDRIAAELGVSHTPVREALQSLRAEDMVLAVPRRGFVVAELTRGDVADLFEVQADLTGTLAARAAGRLGPADLDDLRTLAGRVSELCGRMPDDAGPEDLEPLVSAEHRLHAEINRLASSRKLAWLVGRSSHYLPAHFYTGSPAWRTGALRAHSELLDALGAADPEAARSAMRRHVLDGRDLLLAHLDTIGMWTTD
ncbi:Transcriptional regulator, GntR family [Pseudonocardia sp. Ae168_Ps1]|uniref:GntR family transcriptional regulator n=1 Tax=unclassified Pseudonocardia TaxID=2619320 RepID=UPI000966EE5F|nr:MULTISPECIES: GntR family transcriptional regulator [unclassified Pseudonocardia]OLL75520.1 Transcriptional regulator, GntR family [Pseudonocardia sp. Ae150A_Ps1]OLL81515.1 Transcriptional regulator, GntR family [Pseudonocardia sp. Ae168_Ps1]OLL84372.1 Transcriptional regulator, GntR family [Pseudonocardia sp. Ae263_Ps1]OLL95610.1 Transcriptional regulator, GntR family [Pseudonocardia sp. Ae356_Ps1]